MPTTTTFPPPGFRRFWTGEAITGLGAAITGLALQTLVVLDLDGGATETGLLSSARWLPYLAFGLLVGALVDRVRRRPVMVVTDLIRLLLLLAIPAAWAAGALSLPLVLGVVACYGLASLANDAASQSFVTRLVPRQHLQPAHARLDGAAAVAETGGPALGGVLIRLLGAPLTFVVSAFGHAASMIAVATLATEEPPPAPRREKALRSLGRDIAVGVQWVYRESGLRVLALATHLWFAANAVLGVVLAPFALRELGLSTVAFGLAAAAAGVGALVGATTSGRIGIRVGTGGAIIVSHSVSVAGVLVIASALLLAANPLAAAVALGVGQALHGFAMGLSNSHEMAYRQSLTPDDLQARTNTTMRSFNRAVVVVVSPVAGLLADRVGLGPMLLVSAVLFLITAVSLLAAGFRHARVAEEPPPSKESD
ncbi:MFS transporter [Pseudactinotalea terrae]|uniref:MFS transporter n=1 Tax=Pseudactinotalea terrae TaxID=1743262 RepID=UPI001F503C1F|nr:MFS transporter [Pseudactinotalea terrae]